MKGIIPSESAIFRLDKSDFETSIDTFVSIGIVAVSPFAGMKQSIPKEAGKID